MGEVYSTSMSLITQLLFCVSFSGDDGKPITKPPSKPAPKPKVRITAKIDKPEPPKRTASSNSKTRAKAVRESKRVKLLQSEIAKRQEEEEEASDDEDEIELQKAKAKRKKDKKRAKARESAKKEKKPRKERKQKRRVSIASAGDDDDDDDDDEHRQGETLAERWHQNFKRLKKFHRAHGHCQVARKQDKTLSYWVSRQRQLNYSQQLRSERRELLDSLNFEWYMNSDVPEHYFDEMLGRLKEFRQEFGHVQVPTQYMRGGLGEWVEG